MEFAVGYCGVSRRSVGWTVGLLVKCCVSDSSHFSSNLNETCYLMTYRLACYLMTYRLA